MRSLLAAAAVFALAQPLAVSAPGEVGRGEAGPAAQGTAGRGSRGEVVRVEHHDPTALPSRGPANALVTIELFFTPGQNSRIQAYRLLEKLQAEHPTRVRLLYRLVKGGGQSRIHYAALFAHGSGKFFEFMDAFNAGKLTLTDKDLADLAVKVGLDPDRMAAAIANPPAAYNQILDANERRRKQRIRNNPPTPNVLFNGSVPSTQLSAFGTNDLDREYRKALDRALELLDHGIEPAELASAFDQVVPAGPQEIVVSPGSTDEEIGEAPKEPVLASPPLDLRGLPSYGPAEAATTIVVMCAPNSANCNAPLRSAKIVQELYPESVRVVWAPFYDVSREDAADLSQLADAALCAEKLGVTVDRDADFSDAASPGWRWVEAVLGEVTSRHRRIPPTRIIDKLAEKLHVDRRGFATCRAQIAGASIAWIEATRHSGARVSPSTVVGGRLYGPIIDRGTLQLLVEAELEPGWLSPSWMHPDSK
ncbi:MAG: hypothetical protein HOV81_16645 [Kofleriaceae bacterium]|nr:hypothetical protein [Kofleriaceae bacterium]